jgi:hypothetical protein
LATPIQIPKVAQKPTHKLPANQLHKSTPKFALNKLERVFNLKRRDGDFMEFFGIFWDFLRFFGIKKNQVL